MIHLAEEAVDRHVQKAALFSRRGDRCLWVAALYAADVVGTYHEHGTNAIADAAGRSSSAVENWAHAVELYRTLRRFGVNSELRQMRYELTLSHFSTMWDLQRKYDLNAHMVMRYLDQMCVYRANGEPYSVEALRREVEAHEGKNTPVTWESKQKSFVNTLKDALVLSGRPLWLDEIIQFCAGWNWQRKR